MEDKNLTEKESLDLIRQMIQTAKNEQKDNGMGWILWGWLLFFASVLTLLNEYMEWFNTFFFWNVFGLVTLLLLAYEVYRYFTGKSKKKVRTYTNDLFDKLNTGFFISLLLIIFSINMGVHPIMGFGLLLGLYGFWILIYGAVMNFKPSIIGAYITWAFAFGSLFAEDFKLTMLLHALAVLFGYIIPGHIAYKEFKKVQEKASV
ncbi:MAG: hypothetical protein ACXWB9_04690 [Flavisolibacter sp.]